MPATTTRSRSHPVMDLEESTECMTRVLSELGQGDFDRETIAQVLGHSNAKGGLGARKVAALSQFGYLSRSKGLYTPTDLSIRVCRSRSDEEKAEALREALLNPPLFQELFSSYQAAGRVPVRLENALREHGISPAACESVAKIFKQSAEYAGVIDSDCKILSTPPAQPFVIDPDEPAVVEQHQRFEFRLTGNKVARFLLPTSLNQKDLEIIGALLKFLENNVRARSDHERESSKNRPDTGRT